MDPLFVCVHSPSVGPATWGPVAERLAARGFRTRVPDLTRVGEGGPPFWPRVVDAVLRSLADVSPQQPVVLAAHSNAGLFVPVIREAVTQPVAACVFVDAGLPAQDGSTPVAEGEFLQFLQPLVGADALLPPWTDWFDESDVAPMFPDAKTREIVCGEQPRLPLSYYEQTIPVPAGWDDGPGAYILFGRPYERQAERARERGWPVFHVPGGHLHQIVEPDVVADVLLTAIGDRGAGPSALVS